jgi:hypothetical protein
MLVRSKFIIENQQMQIEEFQQEIKTLRELLKAKNQLITVQQNEIFKLEREKERRQGSERFYG